MTNAMTNDADYTPAYREAPACLVCGRQLSLRLARGRKSGKPFLMLVCPVDGRHFRGFVTQREYVAGVLARLEGQTPASVAGDDANITSNTVRRSTTKLEPEGTP